MRKIKTTLLLLIPVLMLSACAKKTVKEDITVYQIPTTAKPAEAAQSAKKEIKKPVILTFAGDLMAHDSNTRMKDYSLIYKGIKEITLADDLSFLNVETPVYDEKDFKGYPRFNVKKEYPDAAIAAGFDVFTVANNHTNDQGEDGVKATYEYFEKKRKDNIYFAGIRKDKEDIISYELIEVKGWKILFAAVTEFYNKNDDSGRVDVARSWPAARREFKKRIKKLREDNPADLFVLAVHSYEAEYELEVKEKRSDYFKELLAAGVDVVWGGHPHVPQRWESVKNKETGTPEKAIIYSLGNFVSGQRYKINYKHPDDHKQYTGDSFLLQFIFEEKDGKPAILNVIPVIITSHMRLDEDKQKYYTVERLTGEFADSNPDALADYYIKRIELMEKIIKESI
ncbi:poly-gamma-glutamate synthesis protein (capsule biosynthesis protein) [Elusimicrobium posterum]|uniref:CapA family protein n=1 Tax=Elusimicrobium posterum TaxID=3116653 RepID=UPI003C78C305